jgi:glutamine amidotransferase
VEAPTDALFQRTGLRTVYYANSFVCRPEDPSSVMAWSSHEQDRFPAAVRTARTIGVQFHPEKSSATGVTFVGQLLDDLLKE